MKSVITLLSMNLLLATATFAQVPKDIDTREKMPRLINNLGDDLKNNHVQTRSSVIKHVDTREKFARLTQYTGEDEIKDEQPQTRVMGGVIKHVDTREKFARLIDSNVDNSSKNMGEMVKPMSLSIAPNPVLSGATRLSFANVNRENVYLNVIVMNSFGVIISQEKINVTNSNLEHTLNNLGSLTPGIYYVAVSAGRERLVEKMSIN